MRCLELGHDLSKRARPLLRLVGDDLQETICAKLGDLVSHKGVVNREQGK